MTKNLLEVANKIIRLLPESKRLPWRYWASSLSNGREAELNYLEHLVKDKKTAIDVGANEGLYTFGMSKIFDKVYSFDANSDVTKEIESYNSKKIQVINKGLSFESREMILYIPVINEFPLLGWASFDPKNFPDAQKVVERKIEVHPLDKFAIPLVSFIKIDVEGHELEVLRGAVETLKRCHPVMLVEIREQNLMAVERFLANLGYTKKNLRDFVDADGSEGNYIFI